MNRRRSAPLSRIVVLAVASASIAIACGSGSRTTRGGEHAGGEPTTAEQARLAAEDVTPPRERAEAGGWTTPPPGPVPFYCNDEGGTEWCEGTNDDDCDGEVDEGCADCVRQPCERYRISADQVSRGSGRAGEATCVGPVYCGRVDGHATTSPPGGCGHHHCGTIVWSDGTAQPNHCTIYGRCAGGEFLAKGFTW